MPLSSLPPEILREIIESSVPPSFHTHTYEDRQSTLFSLSLVSRRFRSIAQPLLVEIVSVDSARKLHVVLDQIAWAGWSSVPRHFSVWLQNEGAGTMSTHRLPEIIPSLQSLTLGTPGDVLDLAFLNRFECLTDLQLACSGFNVPTSIVLPHVRSLALTSTSPEMISELLSPNILPSLRSLGICFAPNHRLLSNPRLLSLFSQVEVLCIRISTWNSFTGEERLKFTSRTLIEAYSAQLGFIAETAMEATNMCVQGLGDFLEEEEGLNEEIKSSIKRFIQTLRRAKTIRLRLLYFEEDPRGNPELPEEAEELIDELLEECRKREIEVVFARLPSEIEMDSYILADFEARQQKLARQGGSG